MDTDRDYYAVLGVLPSVDAPVLHTMYRSLESEPHVEVSGSYEKKKRFSLEFKIAYEVLKDPEKRRKYDEARNARNEQAGRYDQIMGLQADGLDHGAIDDEWEIIKEYEPVACSVEKRLRRISAHLSLLFRVAMLSHRDFVNAEGTGRRLEEEFFNRYFGDNKKIHTFARRLLLSGDDKSAREAALELNRVIRTLRNPSDPEAVMRRISEKFGLERVEISNRRQLPNTPEGWRAVITAAEARGWKYKGIFSPKFVNAETGEVITPETPELAYIQMGLHKF